MSEKQKITITRALAELKLLDARILKQIAGLKTVGLYQERTNKGVIGTTYKEKEFSDLVPSEYQSTLDLIKRRATIKSKIMLSNSLTLIKIGDQEMTVAQAIDHKAVIQYEEKLLGKLRLDLGNALSAIEKQKPELEKAINDMLAHNLGSESKPSQDDYDKIAKPLIEANTLKLADPLKVEAKIKDLEEKISRFTGEIDFVLSESNAKTEIEI